VGVAPLPPARVTGFPGFPAGAKIAKLIMIIIATPITNNPNTNRINFSDGRGLAVVDDFLGATVLLIAGAGGWISLRIIMAAKANTKIEKRLIILDSLIVFKKLRKFI